MKQKFFDQAKELAYQSTYCHKIGAVVVKKNKVIGKGYNKPSKTHPRSTNDYNTVHAELDAILGIDPDQLKDAIVYVYREYKDGTPALAKPCEHCERLLRKEGIRAVYYTGDGTYSQEIFD